MFRSPMRLEKWIAFDGAIGVDVVESLASGNGFANPDADSDQVAAIETHESDTEENVVRTAEDDLGLFNIFSLLSPFSEGDPQTVNTVTVDVEDGDISISLPIGFEIPSSVDSTGFLPFYGNDDVDFTYGEDVDQDEVVLEITNPENGSWSFYEYDDINNPIKSLLFINKHGLSAGDKMVFAYKANDNNYYLGLYQVKTLGLTFERIENYGIGFFAKDASGIRFALSDHMSSSYTSIILQSLRYTPSDGGSDPVGSFQVNIYSDGTSIKNNNFDSILGNPGSGMLSDDKIQGGITDVTVPCDETGSIIIPPVIPPPVDPPVTPPVDPPVDPVDPPVDPVDPPVDPVDPPVDPVDPPVDPVDPPVDPVDPPVDPVDPPVDPVDPPVDPIDPPVDPIDPPVDPVDPPVDPIVPPVDPIVPPITPPAPGPIDVPKDPDPVVPETPEPESPSEPSEPTQPGPTQPEPPPSASPPSNSMGNDSSSDAANGSDAFGDSPLGEGDATPGSDAGSGSDSAGNGGAEQGGVAYVHQKDERESSNDEARKAAATEQSAEVQNVNTPDGAIESAAEATAMDLMREAEALMESALTERSNLEKHIGLLHREYLALQPGALSPELRNFLRGLFESGNQEMSAVQRSIDQLERMLDEYHVTRTQYRDGMLLEAIRELLDSTARRSAETGALTAAMNQIVTRLSELRDQGQQLPGADALSQLYDQAYAEAIQGWRERAALADSMGRELASYQAAK